MLLRYFGDLNDRQRESVRNELVRYGFPLQEFGTYVWVRGELDSLPFGVERADENTLLLSSRAFHPEDTVVRVKEVEIGKGFTFIAGPCAVEGYEKLLRIARAVKEGGAVMLRGGAFKPRTSPYSFQGLGVEGLEILKKVGEETGLPVVSEITDKSYLDAFEGIDLLQIGARNMQNFELLKEVGRRKKKVVLKRGFASTIEEWLLAAEYILSEGGEVILCERGVRTRGGEKETGLDFDHIPSLKKITHLPILIDPSHAADTAEKVMNLAKQSLTMGLDGMMAEVHTCPSEALCDGHHALLPSDFATLTKIPVEAEKDRIITALSYPYYMGKGVLSSVGEKIKKRLPSAKKAFLVTDENVAPLYKKAVEESLQKEGLSVSSVVLPAGEKTKSAEVCFDLLAKAGEERIGTGDAFVALGGGVVGDITSFAASVYRRGCAAVQIPTTLLAGIDSSFGGKNGLDTAYGKNAIGTFWNPEFVLFDTETLSSLPERERKNGRGELLKYAVLSEEIYKLLLENKEEDAWKKAIEYKAEIVREDFTDKGKRHLLNLGHTVGHALEKASNYTYSHGECVAYGVYAEASFGKRKGFLTEAEFVKIQELLSDFLSIPEPKDWQKQILFDKKWEGDTMLFPAIFGIGDVRLVPLSEQEFYDGFLFL